MPLRPCLGCRRPTEGNRCPSCRSALERDRGTTTARGYGADHQRERAAWEPLVATGTVVCRRAPSGLCRADNPVIQPGETWHLGHPDAECPAPKAPEHEGCNIDASNRRTPSS